MQIKAITYSATHTTRVAIALKKKKKKGEENKGCPGCAGAGTPEQCQQEGKMEEPLWMQSGSSP